MKSSVSIIVPVYNVGKYLEKCLESLTNQTYKNLQIICVDDGSTDNSAEILKKYEEIGKIKVIKKKNGGLSSARNAGLKNCETKYVMFCDSDDSFDRKMCEKMVERIEQDGSDIAACGTNVIYSAHEEMRKSDERYYRLNYSGCERVNDEIILNTNVSVSNKIFKMEIIEKNNLKFPDGLNNEDFYFYNLYMSYAKSISFVNEKLYNYERRDGSIMSENFENNTLAMDHLIVAEKLFKEYQKSGYLEKHKDLFWEQWKNSFWFSYEHTSVRLREQVYERGREFVKKYLKEYSPNNEELKTNIKNTFMGKLGLFKIKIRKIVVKIYEKVNIGYRQQKYINSNIEQLTNKYNELSRRIKALNEELDSERKK